MDKNFKKFAKQKIAKRFGSVANDYDNASLLQRDVGIKLINQLDSHPLQPEMVLDLGAGTGYFSDILLKRYPSAHVVAIDIAETMLQKSTRYSSQNKLHVCADFDYLPFPEKTIDIIYSNMALQWSLDAKNTLSELQRILSHSGLLVFSCPGIHTLQELRECWRKIDDEAHVNQFLSTADIANHLKNAGYSDFYLNVERKELYYPDIHSFLHAIKNMGANHVIDKKSSGLTGKNSFGQLKQHYESYRNQKGLTATFEIIYGTAWKREE